MRPVVNSYRYQARRAGIPFGVALTNASMTFGSMAAKARLRTRRSRFSLRRAKSR